MTLPTITPNDHPVWTFRVGKPFIVNIDLGCLDFDFEWACYEDGILEVKQEYAFDGNSVPWFLPKFIKRWMDKDLATLAQALVHDVVLQAKRVQKVNPAAMCLDCHGAGSFVKTRGASRIRVYCDHVEEITWKATVNAYRKAGEYFKARFNKFFSTCIAFWFNPVFNQLRK